MNLNIRLLAGLLVLGSVFMGGCNAGVTAAGASQDQMKATFDKLPLQERAKMLLDRPGPMEDKIKNIKAMYAKEGQTPPADIASLAGGGAPPVPTAPK